MKKFFILCAILVMGIAFLNKQSFADKKTSHADFAGMQLSECADCHKGEGVVPNHGADFAREHRVLASKAGNNCQQCHKQSFCLDCHQGGGSGDNLKQGNFGRDYKPLDHSGNFIERHGRLSKGNQQSCVRCHSQSYCNDCHSRYPAGTLTIKSHRALGTNHQQYVAPNWAMDHSAEARRNLQSCQSCHASGDVCIQCHSSGKTSPHPRGWKSISGNLKDRSSGRTCIKCHLPGTF